MTRQTLLLPLSFVALAWLSPAVAFAQQPGDAVNTQPLHPPQDTSNMAAAEVKEPMVDKIIVSAILLESKCEQLGDAAPDLCKYYCGENPRIDYCSLEDPVLAKLAWATAPADVMDILEAIKDDLRGERQACEATPAEKKCEQLEGLFQEKSSEGGAGWAGGAAAEVGVEMLERSLSALAKFIADRAKRELIGWMLDKVGHDLCSKPDHATDAEAAIQQEIEKRWLPSLCSLAVGDRLDHYGAGNALLVALRGALESDLRNWPGVVVGLALGEIHYAQTHPDARPPAMIECLEDSGKNLHCPQVTELRNSGERFVARLLDGTPPATALHQLGTSMASQVVEKRQNKNAINDIPLALVACGISIPAEASHFLDKVTDLGTRAEQMAVVSALVTAPACWQLFGKGYKTTKAGDLTNIIKALEDPNIERLSTTLRLYEHLAQPVNAVAIEVATLRAAQDALRAARAAKYDTPEQKQAALWQQALAVVDAALATADATLAASIQVADPGEVLPGLELPPVHELPKKLTEMREVIQTLRDAVGVARDIGTGDVGAAVARSTSLLFSRAELSKLCAKDPYQDPDPTCELRLSLVGRHAGTIAAILAAKDDEEMAEAIDAAANPPGGWRSKLSKGNLSVALNAYAGFMAAGEVRWGTYGATYEQGKPVYGQAPTLALPLGVDVVWGFDRTALGLFVSALDPAAFLHYDVSASGKLPGPRPVTAVAPGVFFRINLGPTPLVLLAGAVYRPQFRTWEATVSGPGADVLQFGGALAVDVTMWKLWSRASSKAPRKGRN